MVIYNEKLDLIFGALADSTRRGMLAQLSKGETNISALARPYNISQPAISKHLRVLEKAGLIQRTKQGRDHIIRVNPEPAEQARDWIAYYAQFWNAQFNAVEAYLEENKQDEGE
ncbi:MAG: metalloregulator ArsR/SmtB family transcription factor [Chloroflexota bacterium]